MSFRAMRLLPLAPTGGGLKVGLYLPKRKAITPFNSLTPNKDLSPFNFSTPQTIGLYLPKSEAITPFNSLTPQINSHNLPTLSSPR